MKFPPLKGLKPWIQNDIGHDFSFMNEKRCSNNLIRKESVLLERERLGRLVTLTERKSYVFKKGPPFLY